MPVKQARIPSVHFEYCALQKEENKENVKYNQAAVSYQPRRRHLSLVDINRDDGGRVVSVGEIGGWSMEEEVIFDKDMHDRVNSVQKLNTAKIGNVYEEDFENTILSDEFISSEVSLHGQDWNELINKGDIGDDLEDSVFPSRSRFESAVDSLKKARFRSVDVFEVNEQYTIISTKEELLPEEDIFTAEVPTSTSNPVPIDVVDIDKEDGKAVYDSEIVTYMRELEKKFTLNMDFLDDGSVSHSMRSILVDWIVQVQHHLKLGQETLYRTVSMLDMVLHRRDVDSDKLQLLGITCLLVGSKLEEYYPVDMEKLLHLTENSYNLREVLEMELVMIEVLDFQVEHFVNSFNNVNLCYSPPSSTFPVPKCSFSAISKPLSTHQTQLS